MTRRLFCCPSCGAGISPQDIIPGMSKLSPQQQEIIAILAQKPGHFMKTVRLAHILWADDPNGGPANFRQIDVQISRIRKRLGRDVILTSRSNGYALNVAPRAEYAISEVS